jgi:SHS2 domain-containing protein
VGEELKKFEFIEGLTSDVMFRAYGKTLEELLENAALAMFSVTCDVENVKPKKFVKIVVEGEDEEDLTYNWLSELLTVHEIENMFFSKFDVEVEKNEKGYRALGKAYGETIETKNILTVVKAVTYHEFSVKKEKDRWVATVVLDI